MAEVDDKLKDYEIKKEGEAEILLHKRNSVFYNPVQRKEEHRSSLRLAARPSPVPVAWRAQQKLMRELDFLNNQASAPDAAVTDFIDMFVGNLPEQAVKAIRAATRMGNKKLAQVLAVMAEEAAAVDVETQ